MKKHFYFSGFLALMLFDTLAQLSFKAASLHAPPLEFTINWFAHIFSQFWIYGSFIGAISAFLIWMTLLKHAPVGPAFAASHMEIVSVTLLSAWLFHEELTMHKIIGGSLIVAGILCLAKGAKLADN